MTIFRGKIIKNMFFNIKNCRNTCENEKLVVILQCKSRDGAVVARWAHNPKVVSSSLAPATKEDKSKGLSSFFLFLYVMIAFACYKIIA